MQSGLLAINASASVVAATPRSRSRPASLPASWPSFSGLDTHTPVSSSSGRASMPAIACRPTLPVLHCTTFSVMAIASLQIGERELHVGLLQPTVDVQARSGEVGAGRRGEIHDGRGDVVGRAEPA